MARLRIKKLALFACSGVLGCLLGAVIGEIFLYAFTEPASAKSICVLVDCSGSMGADDGGSYSKLAEVKSAAISFVEQSPEGDEIGIVGFGGSADVVAALDSDLSAKISAVQSLGDGGSTNMTFGLQVANVLLQGSELPGHILLFTDGMPDSQSDTLATARACREKGTTIVAIGTGDADRSFLGKVTNNYRLVIPVESGDFEKAFRSAGNLIQSSRGSSHFVKSLVLVAIWTAFVALFLSLFMLGSQRWYMKKPMFNKKSLLTTGLGGAAAGIASGAIGQLAFSPLDRVSDSVGLERVVLWAVFGGVVGTGLLAIIKKWSIKQIRLIVVFSIASAVVGVGCPPPLSQAGRLVGWGVLGGIVGFGMMYLIPNLNRNVVRAGSIGGILGAIFYQLVTSIFNEMGGRLVGASILGACIGLMIVIVEQASRELKLKITYKGGDAIWVNLGNKPIVLGSDSDNCDVYVDGVAAIAAKYQMRGTQIHYEDMTSGIEKQIKKTDEIQLGNVVVEIGG